MYGLRGARAGSREVLRSKHSASLADYWEIRVDEALERRTLEIYRATAARSEPDCECESEQC
jgi:hypothetical protein